MNDVHEGGCVCGRIRLRAQGKPVTVGLCHCLDCRKAHAAPFAAFITFPPDAVTFLTADGEATSDATVGYWDNGRGYKRHFCRACGSRLHGTQDKGGDVELHPAYSTSRTCGRRPMNSGSRGASTGSATSSEALRATRRTSPCRRRQSAEMARPTQRN